jgi:nicotinamidase-related amidase
VEEGKATRIGLRMKAGENLRLQGKHARDCQLGDHCAHLCVDAQRMFLEQTEWHTPWFGRVLPQIVRLVADMPERTFFTRFIPAKAPGEGHGTWRNYYVRWASMTLDIMGKEMAGLVPELAMHVPPAHVVDKTVYSPWLNSDLHAQLQGKDVDTLIISGGETDICVLATALGAIDCGYRTILLTDALFSSVDETHDKVVDLYRTRFDMHVETATVDEIIANWR